RDVLVCGADRAWALLGERARLAGRRDRRGIPAAAPGCGYRRAGAHGVLRDAAPGRWPPALSLPAAREVTAPVASAPSRLHDGRPRSRARAPESGRRSDRRDEDE